MMWVLCVITFCAIRSRKTEETEYTYNHLDVAFVLGTPVMDCFYFLNIDLNFFRLWSRFLLKMMWVLRVITFRALGGRKVEEIEYTYNHPDVAFVPGTSNGLFLFFKY